MGRDDDRSLFSKAGIGRQPPGEIARAQSPDPPRASVSLPGQSDRNPLVPARFSQAAPGAVVTVPSDPRPGLRRKIDPRRASG